MLNIFRLTTAKPKPKTIRTTKAQMVILGKRYPIQIVHSNINRTTIHSDHIEISLNAPTRENFIKYSSNWYRNQARREFTDSMNRWLPEFERIGYEISTPRLKIYGNMRRAWGRCFYTRDYITLSLRLIRLPKECIDYVILHELTHFIAPDHGPLFRAILDKIDPQWREREAQLRIIEQRKELLL